MKKLLICAVLCLLIFNGCGRKGKPLFDPVYFYYPRTEYSYGDPDGVVAWEAMDGTGHMEDYLYLMTEYFSGPVDEGLYNPFPQGTKLLQAQTDGETFLLELSQEALALPEHRFTLGCSCLSMTCFELTPVSSVTVLCGQACMTIQRDGYMLSDDYIPDFTTKTEEQS